MPKLELILIRHGETDWNKGGLFRGHEDMKLNHTGIVQSEATANALKSKVFEAVYTSPLKRALVTARRIALPHEMEVREDLALLDLNFGIWQGRTEKWARENHPKLLDKWNNQPASMKFPGGESVKKAWKRINKGLIDVLATHSLGTVVIVSHRVPLKMMTAYLLNKGMNQIHSIRHDPCAMSVFEIEKKTYVPIVLNDSRHLAGLELPPPRDF